MSSHVVVIDTGLRKHTVKVTPTTYLNDVLEEACAKFGKEPTNYDLKHTGNKKILDLTQKPSQAGLTSGAKLELVVASKSPLPVSIALQLPESDAEAVPGGRLIEKFPNNTTLWLVLRKFETTSPYNLNFTGRGVAQTEAGASGAGRIFFETPVLKWGTKELSSFTDLQKTLAAVGIRTGSQLMRLTFERTEIPLEKAMAEITEYFQEIENPGASGAHSGPVGVSNLTPAPHSTTIISAITGEPNPEASDSININQPSTGSTPSEPSVAQTAASPSPAVAVPENTVVGPNHRSMTVFAAPSSSTPSAAMQPFDEEAYEATVPQIQLHQARLQAKSQNQRLLSDVEREEQERERAAKQAAIKEVKIKIKFPDESWVVATFTSLDSGASLYEHIKGIIRAENHPFALGYFGTKAMTVPNDPEIRLIKDLGFTGNTTVNLRWEPDASDEARKAPTMKEEFANKAKEYVVPEIPDVETGNNNNVPPKQSNNDKKDGSGGGGLGKGKVPKWLGKSFGKK